MSSTFLWPARITGAVLSLLLIGFVGFAFNVAQRPIRLPEHVDGIIALTGGEARIGEAVRLLAEHRAERMLITGVNRHTSRADLVRLAGGASQLFDCCIDIGYWARDTFGNAEEARAWVRRNGFTRLIVVTSSYHMPRSLAELARALPEVELIAHPVTPLAQGPDRWWVPLTEAKLLVVEYLKLLPALARLGATRMFGTTPDDPAIAETEISGL